MVVAATAAAAPAPEPTLVLNLESRAVAAAELETLSEELRAELARFAELKVISTRDVAQILGVAQQKQMMGCDTDSCFAEVAGALGAAKIVSGTIGAAGAQRLVQLQLIDAATATVQRRVSHASEAAGLVDAVRTAARKLMAVPATLHLINQVQGAEVFVADRLVGTMPIKPFPVQESGTVSLRVEHVDYLPYDAEITVTPGQTSRHILRVQRYTDLQDEARNRRLGSYALLGGGALLFGAAAAGFIQGALTYDAYSALDARRTDQATLDRLAGEVELYDALAWSAAAAGTALAGIGAFLFFYNPAQSALDEAGTSMSVLFAPGPVSWIAAQARF